MSDELRALKNWVVAAPLGDDNWLVASFEHVMFAYSLLAGGVIDLHEFYGLIIERADRVHVNIDKVEEWSP